jgi:hypothetical protein
MRRSKERSPRNASRTCATVLLACCLTFGAALGAQEIRDGSALVPAHSTVVLLAGLAGDVESENLYRDQLQSWLEILAGAGQARDVFVLCDNPEAVTLPAPEGDGSTGANRRPSVSLLKADRSSFLKLTQMLAGRTNGLSLIAWGHGGLQRDVPVFHVHGPRLTPADFKTLADALPGGESRWILMFRGSGTFAARLAGERRQILSSESDTMFASDPVGMSLLTKLARGNPALSFAALGEDLGRATTAWYQQRNLARTEEPTLWMETEKPRLLAAKVADDAFASVKAEDASNSPTASSNAEAGPVAGPLPDVWKDIKRIEPKEYPDADAVVLRRRLNYTLGSTPAIASEQEEFIQILTPEGKRFGDFDVSYSPPEEEMDFLDCEVLRADGKLVRLDPDAIRDARSESMGDYQTGQRKIFSLPGVAPGAVLHVRYRTEWKEFPMPYISLAIPIADDLPILEADVQVSFPKGALFHFAFDTSSATGQTAALLDPYIKHTSVNGTEYSVTYSWHLSNLPAQEHELLAPPGKSYRLLVSTFPDWPAFAEWYGRVSKLTDEVTPEIAAKAEELTHGAKSDRDKVLALYNYVTRLRYVAIPLGVNSFRPHAAANVLQNQFGDCKDKANLFDALLHSLKIDAHLVLVPRFSQARADIPGLAFNHAISRVMLDGQTLWVDTTDDVCRFGMLPPGDPGRKVLVIDGQSTNLSQLPAPEPKDHLLKLHGEVDGSGPAPALPITLSAVASGFPDYELRAAAREAKARGASLPLLSAHFHPVSGTFALEKQSSTSVAALDEKFSWQAEGTCVGAMSVGADTRLLRVPFWLPIEWDLALHHRKSALFLNQGYPLALEEEFEITLPAKAQSVVLPRTTEDKHGPLQWRIEWQKSGDNRLTARFRAELAQGEFSTAEITILQQQLRDLLAAMAGGASFLGAP